MIKSLRSLYCKKNEVKNKNLGALRSLFKKNEIFYVNIIHVVFFPVKHLLKFKKTLDFFKKREVPGQALCIRLFPPYNR
jgi:hypothetical protein